MRNFFVGLSSCLLLFACASTPAMPEQHSAVGWSVDGTMRGGPEDGGFTRFIISGPPDAVDDFTRDAQAEDWTLEARSAVSADLVFAQFRAPLLGRPNGFMDRYILENPRRLNIAGVVAKAETR